MNSYQRQALAEEDANRLAMRQTLSGKLLVRYGFEPYDTESSARRVAERAAQEIEDLKAAICAHLNPLTDRQKAHEALRKAVGLE